MKFDPASDAVIETAVAVLRNQGAEIIDITIPRFVLGVNLGWFEIVRDTEFRYQIEDYLRACLGLISPRPTRTSSASARVLSLRHRHAGTATSATRRLWT